MPESGVLSLLWETTLTSSFDPVGLVEPILLEAVLIRSFWFSFCRLRFSFSILVTCSWSFERAAVHLFSLVERSPCMRDTFPRFSSHSEQTLKAFWDSLLAFSRRSF